MRVVVAINDKCSAETALNYLLHNRYAADSKIHLIHAIAPGFADEPVAGYPDVQGQERQEAEAVLSCMAQQLNTVNQIEITTAVLPGECADVIAAECERFNADLAVVATHARRGLNRLWSGSMAYDIAAAVPCSVAVLKIPQEKQTKQTA